MRRISFLLLVLILLSCNAAFTENGANAWLRYARLDAETAKTYDSLPATTILLGNSAVLNTAQKELLLGVRGMLGRTLRIESGVPTQPVILLGSTAEIRKLDPAFRASDGLEGDAYALVSGEIKGQKQSSSRGRAIAESFTALSHCFAKSVKVRVSRN
jgi:alpha-glucuronidase